MEHSRRAQFQRPQFSALPEAGGLYDPQFEHDGCGVSFVVDVLGRPSRDIVRNRAGRALPPRPPRRLRRRGQHRRRRRDPDPGPRLLPARRHAVPAPGRGEVRSGAGLPPRRSHRGRQDARSSRGDRQRRRSADRGLAGSAHRRLHDRTHGPQRHAQLLALLCGGPRRRLRHRPRPQALHSAQALRARDRATPLLPLAVEPHARLQGDAHHPAASRVLRRSARRPPRVGAGARAQPVLHEHVPVVAARTPLSVPRAQRRDQHAAGQPELDAGARSPHAQRPHARARARVSDRHSRRVRHRELRRVPRAPASGRAPDLARGVDDDPGGVGEPRDDAA